MTEGNPEAKQEETTPASNEQNQEEGEDDPVPAENNETVVIEPADETDPDTTPEDKKISEEEPGTEMTSGEFNAADPTEAVVKVETLIDDVDSENKPILSAGNAGDAEVTFTNGCVNDSKLVAGKDLTFKIEPGPGRVLDKWGYVLSGDKPQDPKADKTAVAGWEEKITKETLLPKGKDAQSVTIYVKTKAAGYKVMFADGEGNAFGDETVLKIYEVVTEDGADKGKLKAATVTQTAGITVAQDGSKDFALELVNTGKVLETDNIKLNGQTIDFGELKDYAKVGDVDGAAATKAYPFTVEPSECMDSNEEAAEALVKIPVRDAYTLTVPDLTYTAAEADLQEADGTNGDTQKFVKADASDGSFATTDLKEGHADYEKTKIAFAVKPKENYKITSVTAKVKKTDDAGDGEEVDWELAEVPTTGAKAGIHQYTIDLNQTALVLDANKTLTIKIETDVDDAETNTAVHKITFDKMDDASDLNNVTIKGGTSGSEEVIANAAEKTIRTLETSYSVIVEAKPGYALVEGKKGEGSNLEEDEADFDGKKFFTIVETRKYDDIEDTVDVSRKVEAKAAGAAISFAKNTDGDKKYQDGAETAKAYTVLSAVVKVGVAIEKNDDEKLIAIENKLKDAGAVVTIANADASGKGVYKDQYPQTVYGDLKDDTYTVADDVDLLTVTVTSATVKPVVKLGTGLAAAATAADTTLEGTTTEGSGVYTYSIPASILSDDAAKVNKIVIDKDLGADKNVEIKVDKSTNIASLKTTVESDSETAQSLTVGENQTTTLTDIAKVGQKIKLVFTAAPNVTFGDITAKMGETTLTAVIGTKDNQATATIETTVTDAITIDVKTVSPYYVQLSGGGGETGDDGAYHVDYNAANIRVDLMAAGTSVNTDFYDIAVKDGSATAVTTAKLDTGKKFATIEKIEPAEWGKTLTIEVQRTKNKEDKYTAALVVSASSDEVTVTDVATNTKVPEDGITVRRDDSFTLRVTPKAGATKNDLKLMLCDATGKKDTKAEALFENGAGLALDGNNKVTLKALAAAAAYDGDVYLGVFNDRNGADGKPQTAPLQGGLVKIKVADPVVLSADITEVKVTSGDSANKDSNKSIGVNMNLGLAKNAKIKKPLDNDLYYKVEVTDINGSATEGELKTYKSFTKYIQIESNGSGYYDASAFALYDEFNLVESYKPANAKEALTPESKGFRDLNIPGTISASVKVTLVQGVTGSDLDESTNDAKNYVPGKNGSASLATKLPIYETKLGITKMNNATVFSGQKAVVAVPKFTAATSKNGVEAKLINTKTGKTLASYYDESVSDNWQGISTWVDGAGNVWVKATTSVYPKALQTSSNATTKDNFKNLAVKITASVPVAADEKNEEDKYAGYAATAVLKIKVQQGIYAIEAEQGKAALSENLYQDAKGNVKAVTIKPRFNGGVSDRKPAKSAVTWAITGDDGAPISTLDPHMQDAVTGKKPLITVKNGKITVNKKYKRAATKSNEDADTFYVTATAADFTTGDNRSTTQKSETWEFTITGANQTIGSLVVVNGSDVPVDAASLKAEDFKNGSLYIAAVKPGAEPDKVSKAYDETEDYIPVTFKAAGKLIQLTGNGSTKRGIHFLKPGTTKITATTVDGGKGTGTKAELSLTVAAYGQMGLEFTSSDGITTEADVTAISYYGGSNVKYTMRLRYYDAATKTWKYESGYKNVKVAVKGGKSLPNKTFAKTNSYWMGDTIVVTDKKGVATVTLTDTATKKTLATYTITNNSNMSTKAPSVKVAKIQDYYGNVQKKVDRNSGLLTFQVTTSDKKLENYAGKYIKLTPDFTVDSTKNKAYSWLGNAGVIEKIDENGQFTKNIYVIDNCSYKVVATVGELKDGEFVALAKDAKFSFNASNKKYNDNLKIGAKYVLDAQGTPRVPISVTTGKVYYVEDVRNIIKKDKDQKANDHMNNFTDYFQVWDNYYQDEDDGEWYPRQLYNKDNYYGYAESYATIGLRTDLTAEQIKYITGQDPATAKAAKADCEGYITVSNGTYSKDVKITISFNKKGVKFTAAADPVYAGTKQQVEIPVKIMNGKQEVRVDEVVLDGTNTVVEKDKDITVSDGRATLKTVKELKAGTYEINLRVQPEDAAYNGTTKDKADDKKAIENVTKTYGVPVTLKLEVKDLADTKMINVGKNLKYSLSSLAYNGYEYEYDGVDYYKTGNGYQIGAKGESGYYQVDVPYTLAAANAKLTANTSKETYVKVDLDEKLIKPDSKKPALIQADTVFSNGNKGVLQIRVAKQFIETCDKMAKKDKPLTGWNKKLVVPVSIQPVNTAGEKGAAQTVTFTLTTPKAPVTFAQVQEKVKAANLNKIQTANLTDAAQLLSNLRNKVVTKLQTIVAADADVLAVVDENVTGVKPEEGAAETNAGLILAEGKAVVTIKLTDWSKKDSEPVDIPLTFNLTLDQSSGHAYAIKDAIDTKNSEASWNFTNDTTEKDLLDEVRKIPAVQNILMKQDEGADTYSKKTRKDNISMKVTSFTKVKASTETGSMVAGTGAGSISATITIIDLLDGQRYTANISGSIKTLTNIVSAYDAVKTKFETANVVEGIFQKCAGNKDSIVKELEAVAKKAVKDISATSSNADVVVTVPESSVVVVMPKAAVAAVGTENQDGYVAAKPAVTGKLSFKVSLKEGDRVKSYSKSIDIESTEADKYVDLAAAEAKVTTAVKGTKADGTSDADWEKQIDSTLKSAITTVTIGTDFAAETDAQKKKAIEDAIEENLNDGVLDGSASGIYGYEAVASVSEYQAASKTKKETISFTVTVKPMVGEDGKEVTVTGAELSAEDPTMMTKVELQEALDGVTKVTVANVFTTDNETTIKSGITTAVDTAIKALVPANQNGELKGADITVDVSGVEYSTEAGENTGETKITAIKKVKVTVKKGATDVIPAKTYDSITVETPTGP